MRSNEVTYRVTIVFTDGTYQNTVKTSNGIMQAYSMALVDARALKAGPTFYGRVISHKEEVIQ